MLNKKMFRDIKKNLSQFITIFLMVFLGVFVYAGVHSYMDGMDVSGKNYYEENNLQDLWLVKQNFTLDDLNTIKSIDNVKNAERQLSITTSLKDYDDVTLETIFIESNDISKMYVVEGTGFDSDKKGVWFDSYLARYLNLKVGDKITLNYQGYELTEEILGLINTPDHVYFVKDSTELFPTHKDYGYVYLSINEFPTSIIDDELKEETGIDDIDKIKENIENFDYKNYYVFNNVIVDVDNIDDVDFTKLEIEAEINDIIAATDRSASPSYEVYNSEIEEGTTYSNVFTALFLFIAILSVVTTMKRFVKKQRMQIGTLKALGFRESKIVRHYISYGFYISLFASIMGLLLGNLVLGNYFLNVEMSYFEVPMYHTVIIDKVYILAILIVVIVILVTYFSCKKVLKESASESLRLQLPKVKNAKFNLTTKGIFKKSSLTTRWNLRDIFRNKGRSIMAIVGIVGSCMLIVCAFGLLDSMNGYLDWKFKKISKFKYKITLDSSYTDSEFSDLTEKYGNATSESLGIEVKDNDGVKLVNTLTVNDAKDYLKYTDHNKNYIDLNSDGVYITEKLSKTLNLKLNDTISFRIFGSDNWYDVKISGINRDPQSQQLNMTKEFYESLDLEYRPDTIYTNLDLSSVKELPGVSQIQGIETLRKSMESMLNTMKTMLVILILVSSILNIVIIYNLGILSFTEKNYQFSTLKVLGFKDKQIRKIFVRQNIWLTIIAIIIGLPLGFLMTDYIFKSALGESYDFNASIKLISYVFATFETFVVSFIVNKILSKKVDKIDMVTSLKGNE